MHIEIQKFLQLPPDPLPGLRPWTPLGDFCPPDPRHRTSPHILYQVYAPGEMPTADAGSGIGNEDEGDCMIQQG